ncbi:MAG: hypothetical protein HYV63_25745 [Candidatus Schekmanbacteria bacterium]|nr:hypothetical protein [Candidatus Schekmanbacteria bacterium]
MIWYLFAEEKTGLLLLQITGAIVLYMLWRYDRKSGRPKDEPLIPLKPHEVMFLALLAVLSLVMIG